MSGFHALLSAEPTLRLRDNPLLLAQCRRRLRPRQALPLLVVVGLVGVFAVLGAAVDGNVETWMGARVALVVLAFLVLHLGGSSQVGGRVDDDRAGGLLDFHRASPTTPWTDGLGYLLGCAAREHATCGVLLPFLALAHFRAGGTAAGLGAALLVLLSSALLYHLFAMFTGLTAGAGWLPFRRGRRVRQTAVTAVVALVWFSSALVSGGQSNVVFVHLTPAPGLAALGFFGPDVAARTGSSLFGHEVHPVLVTLVVQATFAAFLAATCARKLRTEGAHSFSRPGALLFFVLVEVLVLGLSWGDLARPALRGLGVMLFLPGGLLLAVVLALSLVPTRIEELREERRARRAGHRVAPLATGAPAIHLVLLLAPALLGGALLAASPAPGGVADAARAFGTLRGCLVVASGIALLAVVVGLVEKSRLAPRDAWWRSALLGGFLLFVLPWLVAGVLSTAEADSEICAWVAAPSPVFGVGAALRRFAVLLTDAPAPDALTLGAVGGPEALSIFLALVVAAWLFVGCARERASLSD